MLQQVGSNKLRKFDYAFVSKNKKYHGTWTPPVYDISKNFVPTAAFYGDNDLLTTERVIKLQT